MELNYIPDGICADTQSDIKMDRGKKKIKNK